MRSISPAEHERQKGTTSLPRPVIVHCVCRSSIRDRFSRDPGPWFSRKHGAYSFLHVARWLSVRVIPCRHYWAVLNEAEIPTAATALNEAETPTVAQPLNAPEVKTPPPWGRWPACCRRVAPVESWIAGPFLNWVNARSCCLYGSRTTPGWTCWSVMTAPRGY